MTVLLWREAEEVSVLVGALEAAGHVVRVPDWMPENGRVELLTSVRLAREALAGSRNDPDELLLVGLGLGAVAAVSLTRHRRRLGIDLVRTVVVGPIDTAAVDPISGQPLGVWEDTRITEVDSMEAVTGVV